MSEWTSEGERKCLAEYVRRKGPPLQGPAYDGMWQNGETRYTYRSMDERAYDTSSRVAPQEEFISCPDSKLRLIVEAGFFVARTGVRRLSGRTESRVRSIYFILDLVRRDK